MRIEYKNPIAEDKIHIRDPQILFHDGYYYLYGSTRSWWDKGGDGFDCWYSNDLINWQFHGSIYDRPANATWNQYQFWAPEVHERNGKFYIYFAAKSDNTRRAIGVAVSDSPLGPFLDAPHNPLTPPEWECLDGHLYTDPQGRHFLFWVYEWVQAGVGEMYIQPLAEDLIQFAGEKVFLFRASDAPWANSVVIDGPSLLLHEGRHYLMWSSFKDNVYVVGYAVADSLFGPYIQSQEAIIKRDGGHNSWFKGPDGNLYTCYHSPNSAPERLCIDRLYFDESGNLKVDETRGETRVIVWDE